MITCYRKQPLPWNPRARVNTIICTSKLQYACSITKKITLLTVSITKLSIVIGSPHIYHVISVQSHGCPITGIPFLFWTFCNWIPIFNGFLCYVFKTYEGHNRSFWTNENLKKQLKSIILLQILLLVLDLVLYNSGSDCDHNIKSASCFTLVQFRNYSHC